MTILNDHELLEMGHILFPEHWEGMDHDVQVQPASVDLRLGFNFQRYRTFVNPQSHKIDPLKDDVASFMQPIDLDEGERYLVSPGHESFVLATTQEIVSIPPDMVARVEGRSSLGRLGLRVHSTAGYIDPGFEGRITLEIDVVGRFPIWLTPGMRVCQLSFSLMSGPSARPYGAPERSSKYQNQKTVQASRARQDKEGSE